MTKKMLIDAAHPEEVRVAVLDQNRVEDFDFESAARKPLRGNIYLARVTRVEPSLQAAFVEYGGNRHGFLAFSEIHPDYYQIPVSDREKLQAAEAEVADLAAQLELAQRGDEEDDDPIEIDDLEGNGDKNDDLAEALDHNGQEEPAEEAPDNDKNKNGDHDAEPPLLKTEEEEEEEEVRPKARNTASKNESEESEPPAIGAEDSPSDESETVEAASQEEAAADGVEDVAEAEAAETVNDEGAREDIAEADAQPVAEGLNEDEAGAETAEDEDGDIDDTLDESGTAESETEDKSRETRNALFERYKEAKRKRSQLLRNYKIQEVIKRRQILLVQVVKEERGNKGAALTTYMSLAGRYCVLMPNTARGGGISRKIPNGSDRRRLRRVVDSLEVPQGMGLIIRTAGAKRTKTEIKRDYEYLLRLWENIRTLTLKSIAPCLIYEEASLIKRAIRDLYDKDISKVLVEGEAGYREAKDFMKMLMPSHAKHVQPYKDRAPIFLRHAVETQLDSMYQPAVRLKSGGYIVIHQTEALVAIDVNSGRATRERNIELTALKTNIEAAQEAARQFRLRDLAGLIVIDFIDMEEPKNNRKVEKALKEALKNDRARIQTGRISSFGLLEMSRQRRRSGIVDGTTHVCPTCSGAGVVRSLETAALRILRAVEGEAISGKVGQISARTSIDVSLYLLNHHRDWLKRIETDNGVSIEVIADSEKSGDAYDLEKSGAPRPRAEEAPVVRADQTETIEIEDEEESDGPAVAEQDEKDTGRKRRRRRKRKKDPAEHSSAEAGADAEADGETDQNKEESRAEADGEEESEDKPKRRRRRGRRGGRRNRQASETQDDAKTAPEAEAETLPESEADTGLSSHETADAAPETHADAAERQTEPVEIETAANDEIEAAPDDSAGDHAANGAAEEHTAPSGEEPEEQETAKTESKPKKPARKGWWSRATGA